MKEIYNSSKPRSAKTGYITQNFIPGRTYLTKSGSVMLFLGYTEQGRFVFYCIGKIWLIDETVGAYNPVCYNEPIQIKYLIAMANELMSTTLNVESIREFVAPPVIIEEFNILNFEGKYETWLAKNKLMNVSFNGKTIPRLVPKKFNVSEDTVKIKELIVGKLYILGGKKYRGTKNEGYRTAYVYLGRTQDKKHFIWGFVGSAKEYVKNPTQTVTKYLINSSYNYHNIVLHKSFGKVYEPMVYKTNYILQITTALQDKIDYACERI